MGFTTAVPEIARVAIVVGMSGGWFAVVGAITEYFISEKHMKAKDIAAAVTVSGLAAMVVGGLVFFGQLIISAIQMWWG